MKLRINPYASFIDIVTPEKRDYIYEKHQTARTLQLNEANHQDSECSQIPYFLGEIACLQTYI
jgi:hypothetical protein